MDNLLNGCIENIEEFNAHPNFQFIKGDIRNLETCLQVVEGMDFITHQAALGSIPRSIQDPINSNAVNI